MMATNRNRRRVWIRRNREKLSGNELVKGACKEMVMSYFLFLSNIKKNESLVDSFLWEEWSRGSGLQRR